MIASLLAIFFYPFTTLKISDSIYIFKAYEIKRKKIILSFLQEMSKNFFVRLLFSIFVFFLCHQTSPILGSILQIILIFLIILYYFGKYVIFSICYKVYYFRFRQLFKRVLLKNQNQFFFHGAQSTRNAAENYKKKSRIFWLDHNMKNDVNSQDMLWNKISENPRFFKNNFQRHSLWLRSMEKKIWFWFLSNARSNSWRNRK